MTAAQLTGLTDSHLTACQTRWQALQVAHQVEDDLVRLIDAAHRANFELHIASGFRSFQQQQRIWDNKFSGVAVIRDSHNTPLDAETLSVEERLFAILRWSALPGASRHHWGSDFDVYAKNSLPEGQQIKLEPWEYKRGHQADFYSWLKENLAEFGFFFPYAKDLGGVAVEPWHISHHASSETNLKQLSLQLLKETLQHQSLCGKKEIAQHLDTIYTQYITNISR